MELKKIHYQLIIILLSLVIIGMLLYSQLSGPTTSIELYQKLNDENFSEKVDDDLIHTLEPTTENEIRNQILEHSPSEVRQYTLLVYRGRNSILIESTPGTRNLEILNIYQLPDEEGAYLNNLK